MGAIAIALFTGFNQAVVVGAALYLLAIFFTTRPPLSRHAAARED